MVSYLKTGNYVISLQDLSRFQQKIDRLERLLGDNNRLVATLRDSLLHHRASWEGVGAQGGASVNLSSAHHQADMLAGCRVEEEMTEGAGEVQVSLLTLNTKY